VRRVQLRLPRTRTPRRRAPAVSRGYRRVLVPVVARAGSPEAVDVASRLAAEHGASILAVAVVEVPSLLPLDAHMVEEEAQARRALTLAGDVGASYGVGVTPRLVRAREAAAAIVEQARAEEVELIVIAGARRRRAVRPHAVFGETIEHVLKVAPCRVLVVAAPADARGRTTAAA
jgi:nucleotide-binding universal stress UspA family protein